MFSAIILVVPWTSAKSMTRSSVSEKSLAVATACTPGRAAGVGMGAAEDLAMQQAWQVHVRTVSGVARDLVHTVMAEGPRPHDSERAWARALFTRCARHTFSLLRIRFRSYYTPMRRLLSSGNTSPLHHVCQLCSVALCWAHVTPDVWPQTHPC